MEVLLALISVIRGFDSLSILTSKNGTSYIKATFQSAFYMHDGELIEARPQVRTLFIFKTARKNTYNLSLILLNPRINKHGKIVTHSTWLKGISFNPVTGKIWQYNNRRSLPLRFETGWTAIEWQQHIISLATSAIKSNQPF